jgi:predicted SAM-dependent methyltransferase
MKLVNIGCGTTYHKNWVNIDYSSDSNYVVEYDLSKGIPLENESVDFLYNSHILEHFSKESAMILLKECHRVLKPGAIIRVVIPDLKCLAEEYLKAFHVYKLEPSEYNEANYNWFVIELIDQLVRDESGGEMLKYWTKENILNTDTLENRIGNVFKKFSGLNINSYTSPITFKDKIKCRILNLLGIEWIEYQKLNFYKIGERHKWMYDEVSLNILLKNIGFTSIKVQNGHTSYFSEWSNYSSLDLDGEKLRKPDSLIVEAIKI